MTQSTNSTLTSAVRAGLHSARENALPGLILWILATAIVAGYYLVPQVHEALSALGRVKSGGGYLYSAVATAIAGGFIPFIWRYFRNRAKADALWNVAPWKAGLFLTLFWAYKGVEIDLFYRLQGLIFGTGANFLTIAPKVLVDQFLYNPLWAGAVQLLAYWFLDNAFRPASLADRALWSSFGPRLVTILISTWGVWLPIVCVVYAMPSELQVPLFNIAVCFWGLMLASLTKEKGRGTKGK